MRNGIGWLANSMRQAAECNAPRVAILWSERRPAMNCSIADTKSCVRPAVNSRFGGKRDSCNTVENRDACVSPIQMRMRWRVCGKGGNCPCGMRACTFENSMYAPSLLWANSWCRRFVGPVRQGRVHEPNDCFTRLFKGPICEVKGHRRCKRTRHLDALKGKRVKRNQCKNVLQKPRHPMV